MARFSIRNPYFIIVVCLFIAVIGASSLARMPVDLFPGVNIPVVAVATFYSGMPPEQIESNITSRYERFFTLASGIDRMESRSLPGVSIIKIYFQPGTDPNAAVMAISNLAMANLRRLPPGTMPPILLKFDASSLPVCLVTVKGEGLSETVLRDTAYYSIRNQMARVPGASVPQPFGGKVRQIMVYVDPRKMEAHQLSPMDVVRSVNDTNLILPAGNVKIGPIDYGINANSQLSTIEEINELPIKTVGAASVRVKEIGEARDAEQIQYNVVRVDGQNSVYVPILKQGGDTNTIAVVDGAKDALNKLTGIPQGLQTNVVFDQSLFVKRAIETLLHEGALGVFLTSIMILIFLGSMRATLAVCLSIPLSALATFIILYLGGSSVNTMILGGLALAFSRLIDNSVVVIENIFRHLEMGESPEVAAEKGGREVAAPVLAATLTTVVVFFPVTLLYGVSKFLFSALALSVVISLFASYVVALTVVPLFCAKLIKAPHEVRHGAGARDHASRAESPESGDEPEANDRYARKRRPSIGARFILWFNRRFEGFLNFYERQLDAALDRPGITIAALSGLFVLSLLLYPRLGVAFFPRTEAGQFVINVKAPSGTRLEVTQEEVKKVEDIIRQVIAPEELGIIVSNIGITQDISAIYTSNSAPHTAFVQVSLKEGAKTGSYEYMSRVRQRLGAELPHLATYFQSGGMVDAVLNLGLPAPINLQLSGSNLGKDYEAAAQIAGEIRKLKGVSDVFIPQDLDAPLLKLDVDRDRVGQLGLNTREVVSNVITSLVSNQMIAPTFWVDPKSGNDYLSNSSVLNRAATGITVNQLIFDFGRNNSLVRSASSRAKSVEQTAEAIRAQIIFQVDRAYFTTLRAQALLKVAEQTVIARQVVVDQTKELQKSGIKSGLDVSMADYSLAESKLLFVRAQNDLRSAFADLSVAIGSSAEQTFELVDEYFSIDPLPGQDHMINEALRNRPELRALQFDRDASYESLRAEKALKKPSVSAVWNAGVVPFRDNLLGSRYNAAGLTVTIPIFNGRIFKAREAEAEYKARASDEQLMDLENRIVRDARVAWLNADNAYQRIELGAQLLNRARESLSLAQQRYRMGLSSIVELTQALLSVTVAEIETANARFEYLLQRSALNYQTGQLH